MTAPIWLQGYDEGVPATLEPYPERTLVDYLSESARNWPDRPALLFKGSKISYRRLEEDSDAFAAALVAIGVKRGDRVALCLPNCPQFMVAEFAAWKAGAIVCPFNPTYTDREMVEALRTTGAETLVVLNRFYDKVKGFQETTSLKRIVTTNIKEYLPFFLRIAYTLLKEKKEGDRISVRNGDHRLTHLMRTFRRAPRPAEIVAAGDPSVILLSGGTTGTPKGVVGLHGAMVIAGLQLQSWLRPAMREWTDTIMLPLPLFHVYGNTGVQSLALINHNPVALIPNPREIRDLLKEIIDVRPTFIATIPTLLNGIKRGKP